ncbi:MAG: transposase [Candidatus Nanopelagicales bacterium]
MLRAGARQGSGRSSRPGGDLDIRIEAQLSPFARQVAALVEITGIGVTAAAVIIAEIGVDMTRFPTAAHLAGWARFAPGVTESAGRKKGTGATGHGNRYLARILGEAAVSAGRTETFLGERYRRIARRRGKKKAIVAVGRSILVVIWHLLSEADTHYRDLGPDFYDTRLGAQPATRNHIRALQALGYNVTLEPAAWKSPKRLNRSRLRRELPHAALGPFSVQKQGRDPHAVGEDRNGPP